MTTWHLHPPPVPFDPADAPLVRREAERQFDAWCLFTGKEEAEKRIGRIEAGLFQMLKVGNARIICGEVRSWHPLERVFVPMDDDLNALYTDMARRPGCYRIES